MGLSAASKRILMRGKKGYGKLKDAYNKAYARGQNKPRIQKVKKMMDEGFTP